MGYFGLEKSMLITADREERIMIEGRTIEVLPMWKWLLL